MARKCTAQNGCGARLVDAAVVARVVVCGVARKAMALVQHRVDGAQHPQRVPLPLRQQRRGLHRQRVELRGALRFVEVRVSMLCNEQRCTEKVDVLGPAGQKRAVVLIRAHAADGVGERLAEEVARIAIIVLCPQRRWCC